jgi:hypothetical protein
MTPSAITEEDREKAFPSHAHGTLAAIEANERELEEREILNEQALALAAARKPGSISELRRRGTNLEQHLRSQFEELQTRYATTNADLDEVLTEIMADTMALVEKRERAWALRRQLMHQHAEFGQYGLVREAQGNGVDLESRRGLIDPSVWDGIAPMTARLSNRYRHLDKPNVYLRRIREAWNLDI